MFCCSCEEVGSNAVVVIAEPVASEHSPLDDVRREEEAERKRKADAEAAVRKQRELEEEVRRKKIAAKEDARQRREALAVKDEDEEDMEEECRRKEAAEASKAAATTAATARDIAAQETVVAKEVACVLPLTFRDVGGMNTYTVNFETKPLCMDFNQDKTPVKVTKAFGAAKRLGVSEGSCLIKISGINVEKLGFAEVLAMLKDKITPLTAEGLVIDFQDTSGQLRPIVFPSKPLGMDFDHGKQPIRIKSVQGVAQALGVEANWVLACVDGTNVENMQFDQVLLLLRAKIQALPTKD